MLDWPSSIPHAETAVSAERGSMGDHISDTLVSLHRMQVPAVQDRHAVKVPHG